MQRLKRPLSSLPHHYWRRRSRAQKAITPIDLKANHIPNLLTRTIPSHRNSRQNILKLVSALLIISDTHLRLLPPVNPRLQLIQCAVVSMEALFAFRDVPVGGLQKVTVLA